MKRIVIVSIILSMWLWVGIAHSMRIGKAITVEDSDLDRLLSKIVLVLKGNVGFGEAKDDSMGENIKGEFQQTADTGTADTEFPVGHYLGYIPSGFIVVNIDKGGIVYKSGGTAWDADNIWLCSTVANCNVIVFIF